MSSATLEQTYTYHPPFGTQPDRYVAIREAGKAFAHLITTTTPPSREQSVALTRIQETVMWGNAAIAIHEQAPAEPVASNQESV